MRRDQILLSLFAALLLRFTAAVDLGSFRARVVDVPICKLTDYPVICVYAAHTYGHKYSAIDPMSMLAMHVEMAHDHAVAARLFASKTRRGPPIVRDAFDVCASQYDDALVYLATGFDAVRGGDAGTAYSYLSAVITSFTTCDDTFAEIPAANPMARRDLFLSRMASNALVFAQMILHD